MKTIREPNRWASAKVYTPAPKKYNYSEIYNNARGNAIKRGIEFTLTRPEFDQLVEKAGHRCMISGLEFTREGEGRMRRPFAPSLDRIDSSKGYSRRNCRIVCVLANLAMNEWGEDPLARFCRAVYKKGLRESVEGRQALVFQDSIYKSVAEYLNGSVHNESCPRPMSPHSLHAAAKRYCADNGIPTDKRAVRTSQRCDGSWATQDRAFYPLPVLDHCYGLIRKHQAEKEETATILQPSSTAATA